MALSPWACQLHSASGTVNEAKAMLDLAKSESSKHAAFNLAVDAVRDIMRFSTGAEQIRIKAWLGHVLSLSLNDEKVPPAPGISGRAKDVAH